MKSFERYGLPRRVISDNGSQFVSAVMQKVMLALGITQNLTPVYHPQANPAERKNRDMKSMLAILVNTDHQDWPKHIPAVRFALNTATNQTTGHTAAYLAFALIKKNSVFFVSSTTLRHSRYNVNTGTWLCDQRKSYRLYFPRIRKIQTLSLMMIWKTTFNELNIIILITVIHLRHIPNLRHYMTYWLISVTVKT
ncbi:unnamed protein product [Chilo suppressalis]|uniref:Integrase catalytic domain-containing protein n=1 Tax=Chilo suppressalis TaxID=168631 RepID=A0ABN8B9T7_CHISP|nr:unnamed protein product [Chilo suppressalis]